MKFPRLVCALLSSFLLLGLFGCKKPTQASSPEKTVEQTAVPTPATEPQPETILVPSVKKSSSEEIQALIKACKEGDLEQAKELISAGVDVDGHDGTALEETPLIYAARGEYLEIVRSLIQAGADVNARDKYGYTALMQTDNVEIIKLLLAAGANVNVQTLDGGFTPLMWASYHIDSPQIVKLFLDAGAKVNSKGDGRNTALSLAIKENDKENLSEIIKLLLAAGADVNIENDEKNTPLFEATYHKRGDKIIQLLLAAGAKDSLATAVIRGDTDAVRAFIKDGMDVNRKRLEWNDAWGDYEEQSLLMDASMYGYSAIAQELIGAGADVNVKDGLDRTALTLAQKAGNEEIVKLLKAAGAKE